MKKPYPDEPLRCSFCHKTQEQVEKLISSPSDYPRAYICNECVGVCQTILEDEKREQAAAPARITDELKEFDEVLATSEGMTLVRQGQAFGFADAKGNVIVKPVFEEAFGFTARLARIS